MRIGLISDTHGLLRPAALDALAGSELIVHAGDIGGAHVVAALRELAPVVAIRGNNDTAAWAQEFPETRTIDALGRRLHVVHDLKQLALDPRAAGVAVVIAGHSHRPLHRVHVGVHYVTPGSAGPRRFKLPVAIARLNIAAGIDVEVVELDSRRE
jgi:putative phosphoesterase